MAAPASMNSLEASQMAELLLGLPENQRAAAVLRAPRKVQKKYFTKRAQKQATEQEKALPLTQRIWSRVSALPGQAKAAYERYMKGKIKNMYTYYTSQPSEQAMEKLQTIRFVVPKELEKYKNVDENVKEYIEKGEQYVLAVEQLILEQSRLRKIHERNSKNLPKEQIFVNGRFQKAELAYIRALLLAAIAKKNFQIATLNILDLHNLEVALKIESTNKTTFDSEILTRGSIEALLVYYTAGFESQAAQYAKEQLNSQVFELSGGDIADSMLPIILYEKLDRAIELFEVLGDPEIQNAPPSTKALPALAKPRPTGEPGVNTAYVPEEALVGISGPAAAPAAEPVTRNMRGALAALTEGAPLSRRPASRGPRGAAAAAAPIPSYSALQNQLAAQQPNNTNLGRTNTTLFTLAPSYVPPAVAVANAPAYEEALNNHGEGQTSNKYTAKRRRNTRNTNNANANNRNTKRNPKLRRANRRTRRR